MRLDYVHGPPITYKMSKGVNFFEEKLLKNVARLSTLYNADVKNMWSSLPIPNVPLWRTSLFNFIMERIVRWICYYECAFAGCCSSKSKVVIMETKTGFGLFRVQAGSCIRYKRTRYHSATRKQRLC
jgi:hypothetical protein